MILGPSHLDLPLRLAARGARLLRPRPAQVRQRLRRAAARTLLAGRRRTLCRCDRLPDPGRPGDALLSRLGGVDAAEHALTREVPAEGGRNSWAAIPLGLPVLGGFDEVADQTLIFDLSVDEEVQFAGPVSAPLEFAATTSTVTSWRGSAESPSTGPGTCYHWARSVRHVGGTIQGTQHGLRDRPRQGGPEPLEPGGGRCRSSSA